MTCCTDKLSVSTLLDHYVEEIKSSIYFFNQCMVCIYIYIYRLHQCGKGHTPMYGVYLRPLVAARLCNLFEQCYYMNITPLSDDNFTFWLSIK